MFKRAVFLAIAVTAIYWTAAHAQHPILDEIAGKVIHKYEQTSCEQLMNKKSEPKTPQEQKAVELLRSKPEMRKEFLDKVAAPIANKMFECGLIP
jgi:hypothetical protein